MTVFDCDYRDGESLAMGVGWVQNGFFRIVQLLCSGTKVGVRLASKQNRPEGCVVPRAGFILEIGLQKLVGIILPHCQPY